VAKVRDRPPEEVKAEYRRHDEIESNPASRGLFESHPVQLDETQREVVDALDAEGYCLIPFSKLFSAELWSELSADAAQFTREMENQLAGRAEPKKRPKNTKSLMRRVKAVLKPAGPKKEKAFMGRRYKETPLTLDSHWLRLGASRRVLDIVNTYLGMWSKLSYADQWYSPPRGPEANRVGSMRWHRDYNDQHLVKVFVYLCDVDEGTGPFEYIPGSARNGPYANEWPWAPLGETYPPQEELERRIPQSAARTFTGPEGSVILCNTSGFHRGGFATEKPRNLFVYNYVSPAALIALVDRNFDLGNGELADLDEVERFALA
jgi:hypothetical protein